MEASVVLVSSSLVFFWWKFCTEDEYKCPLPYNNENTDSSTSIAQIYLDFKYKYKSNILKCHFKFISEKYTKI